MKLRPHHLLCIQKFTGHGYDESFTAHMTALVSLLREDPETEIVLTEGCDALCERCPNRREDKCESFEKVARMDGAAKRLLALHTGGEGPWRGFAEKGRALLRSEARHEVCGSCQWARLCEETEVTEP